MVFNWICPFCSMAQTVVSHKFKQGKICLHIDGQAEGQIGLYTSAIGCSNLDCLKTSVSVKIQAAKNTGKYGSLQFIESEEALCDIAIRPFGSAKPLPDFIPEKIREEYREACLIRELSPRASAALARQCLQSIIRDFERVEDENLHEEIAMLKKAIENVNAVHIADSGGDAAGTPEETSTTAAEQRSANIPCFVDADHNDVQELIDLIELLFEEWYAHHNRREQRLAHVSKIAEGAMHKQHSAGQA